LISSIDLNHNNISSSSSSISDLKTNSTSASGKDFHQIQLLKECLICSLNKSNFSTIICFAFENSIHFQQQQQQHNNNINIISQLSKILKLNRIQEIAIACLLKNCNKEEIKQAAQYTLEQKLTELTQSVADQQSSSSELGIYMNLK
jgi:hypothetical protein